MKKKILFVIGGVFIIYILCILFVPDTIRLNSDDTGIEYVMKGEIVTDVLAEGPFLYGLVTSYPSEEFIQDVDGKVIEEIRTYVMEANFSIRQKLSMKIHIDTSEDIVYTYIFKFADKDVTITNGKVAE